MWALYLLRLALDVLLGIWLSGSLVLPFMLLIRWGGSKWKVFGWLTRTKKRWLSVWGCYGLAKIIAVATFFLIRDYPEFQGGFNFLGWEGDVVWSGIRALHIQRGEYLIEFMFGFPLKAIVNVAVHCGLAAVAWWIFNLFSRAAGKRRRIAAIERYSLSLLASTCAFGIANILNFERTTNCADCFLPYGVPFTLYHEGGFVGVREYVWAGLIGDALIVLVVGLVIGLVWSKLALRHSNLPLSPS